MTGLFNTAISGIHAAQYGMATTEHNITNQNTPGFSRQRNVQATNIPMLTGSGYIGRGTNVLTVERIYDQFLNTQINRAQTSSSELTAYYDQIAEIDNMLADTKAGLSPALQDFFTGLSQMSANPAQIPSRQAMLSSAQSLTSRYQGLETRLSQIYEGLNTRLKTQVDTVNAYAQELSNVNQNIITAQASIGQPPNDLLDQRDHIVGELNKLVQITTTTNSDGSLNAFFGTGQQLVVSTNVMTLTAEPSEADASRIAIGLKNIGGNIQELPESLITGGTLGGLLKFRTETLDRVNNDLGRNAASLALTFNAQYKLGQDLQGHQAGDTDFIGDFFNISGPVVKSNIRNLGDAVMEAAFAPASIDGVYTLTNTGGNYTLTHQATGRLIPAAGETAITNLAVLQARVSSEKINLTGVTLADGESSTLYTPAASDSNYYTKLTTSDYRIDFDGNRYTATRLSDNKQWSAANTPTAGLSALSADLQSSEGFSLSLKTGTLAAGDSFVVKPTAEMARNLTINPKASTDVRLLNAAMPFRTLASNTNTGTGKISSGAAVHGFGANSIAQNVTVTYQETGGNKTLAFAGLPADTNISVTSGDQTTVRPGPSIPWENGARISFNGISFTMTGEPHNNDTFNIARNAAGVSDNRNALALGKLQTQNTMSGKTTTYQGAYAQLVSDTGNKTRQISVSLDAQNALLDKTQAARESLSGVNLDDEAANLVRYQQAYQASAKALSIGSGLFQELLNAIR